MGQTISIDPKMWATIRKLAFDRQTTASKIVTEALEEWFARQDGGEKPRAEVAKAKAPNAHMRIAPWDEPIGLVTKVTETPDGIAIEAERIDVPTAKAGAVIVSAEEAAAKAVQMAAAKGIEFHPVPKPVRKPRTRR